MLPRVEGVALSFRSSDHLEARTDIFEAFSCGGGPSGKSQASEADR